MALNLKMQNPNIQRSECSACRFYGLKSIHKFAEILGLSREELEQLCNHERRNYRIYQTRGKKSRTIEEPPITLKRIQRIIHISLSKIGPPQYLYSAFKGRSAVDNAKQHDGNCPIVKIDIKQFFPSSNGKRVGKFFRDVLKCAGDVAAMAQKLCTIPDKNNISESHLPTGGVTSSILSYFCYKSMFDELFAYANSKDMIFTVMADDITFSGLNADTKVIQYANDVIRKHGLRANFKKQKAWDASHTSKIVTGAVVTPKGLRVNQSWKLKILDYQSKLRAEKDPSERSKLYRVLIGLFTAAKQVEPRYSSAVLITKAQWRKDRAAWNSNKLASSICPRTKTH